MFDTNALAVILVIFGAIFAALYIQRRRTMKLEQNVGSNFAAIDNYFDENDPSQQLYVDTPDPDQTSLADAAVAAITRQKTAKLAPYKFSVRQPEAMSAKPARPKKSERAR